MLKFYPITLADRSTVERYTLHNGIRNCDLAFTNIYCWHPVYHSHWAEQDGFLLLRYCIDGTPRCGYMQPLGIGKTDFTPVLPLLEADARAAGQPLRLMLDQSGLQYLPQGEYALDANRDFEDYIYAADDLRTLAGSGYKPKRNHVSRFTARYRYRFEPLEKRHIEECLRVEAEWRSRHPQEQSLAIEAQVMQRAFAAWDALAIRGGVLYADDRMVAFTYGSAVTADTFCTHIEKADVEYDGVFPAINKFFAESLPAQFTYINREEDLGLEGLRRSKLSYHPVQMCRKYSALRLDETTRQIRALWRAVFGDDDAFIDSFLARFYDPALCVTRSLDGRVVSMAHIVPLQTPLGRMAYIYAVATDASVRGRGLATDVVREAVQRARDGWGGRFDVVALIPDGDALHSFYERLGFRNTATPMCFGAHNTFSLGEDNCVGADNSFDLGTGNKATDKAMTLQL